MSSGQALSTNDSCTIDIKKKDADAFVAHFRERSTFLGKAAFVYRNIFEIDSSVKTADGAWEYPVERWEDPAWAGGSSAAGRTVGLRMSQQEYDAWNTQAELQRELFGSDSEGGEE